MDADRSKSILPVANSKDRNKKNVPKRIPDGSYVYGRLDMVCRSLWRPSRFVSRGVTTPIIDNTGSNPNQSVLLAYAHRGPVLLGVRAQV
jgi:hypothetical protein